jgi:hypothetical protein
MSSEEEAVAWLRAAIEARKATAMATSRRKDLSLAWVLRGHPSESAMIRDGDGLVVVYDEGTPNDEEAAHMVLNDPQDTVARCEAELAILDACAPSKSTEAALEAGDISTEEYVTGAVMGSQVIRLLAGGYKHRPGFPALLAAD